MNSHSSLLAISPVDGRYHSITRGLSNYFSEYALLKYRCTVEIEYFIALCNLPLPQLKKFPKNKFSLLRKIYTEFSPAEAEHIKKIEKETNHDVKAVEYYIKEKFRMLKLQEYEEFVHFGLTSQDINNTAIPVSLKECFNDVILPLINDVLELLKSKVVEWDKISMLSRTHGQPASPTMLGKEIEVFYVRLKNQLAQLKSIPFSGKFGGSVGNFNAHYTTYPDINWHDFANKFLVNQLGILRSYPTTQIEHYDNLAAFCHAMSRINTIMIDYCRDTWLYIMLDYFKLKHRKNETGSSAMPHKINPIDFENAEGNLETANSLYHFLAGKLPVSRLQRDLTDSTVLRNIGTPVAHNIIAFNSIIKGIKKLEVNKKSVENDLKNHPEVLSEAIQNILRREQYPKPYEMLKEFTRNNKLITIKDLHQFIDSLKISAKLKNELKKLKPEDYTGKK